MATRVEKLAAKLWGSYARTPTDAPMPTDEFIRLPPFVRNFWYGIARVAIAELLPRRRTSRQLKVCRVDKHGKRVCK